MTGTLRISPITNVENAAGLGAQPSRKALAQTTVFLSILIGSE